jgi:hypothetical protein
MQFSETYHKIRESMATKLEVPMDTPTTAGIKKMSMVWPMLLGFITLVFLLGRMSMQQDVLIRDFRATAESVRAHIASDGHGVAITRTDNLLRDVTSLQRQIDELRNSMKKP